MLNGYIDDSADDKRQRFAAYGGVLGMKTQMEQFELLWMHETRALTEPFRSSDCEGGHGQFTTWSHRDRVALMKDLVGLIKRRKIWSYGSTVSITDYRSVFPDSGEYGPSLLCATSALVTLSVMADETEQPIAACFEEGELDGRILEVRKRLKTAKPWRGQARICSLTFGSKKIVPLQSADLMAREAFKHFDNEGIRPMRKPLERLTKQLMFHKWRLDGLQRIRDWGYPNDLNQFATEFASRIV
jgi:hypothetical protein